MRILLAVLVVTLVGCASTKSNEPKVEVRYVERSPNVPSVLFKPCYITPPVSIEEYLKLTEEEREGVLTGYINKLLSDLKVCNLKIKSIEKAINTKVNQDESKSKT